MKRRESIEVIVGTLHIGGANPIRVQSMTTTNTADTAASVAQAKRIIDAGGEMVRLTTPGRREAENMGAIKAALVADGYTQPIVADVHFNAAVADIAAEHCDKVRINPGNYGEVSKFRAFVGRCKERGIAIRIGVNHGSLSQRMREAYGDGPRGIVESCMEYLRVCREEQFDNVVLSVKSSNTVVMVQSVRQLVQAMDKENMHYPLHLGVTEAGEGEDGRIKSAVGIGALLTEGIGDTIRVSLSEEPECEIPVARKLVAFINECATKREQATILDNTLHLSFEDNNLEDLQLKAAMTAGAILIDGRAKELSISAPALPQAQNDPTILTKLADDILQAARVRFTKTEYISCPGCGRTLYDLQGTIARIKRAIAEATPSHPTLATLKIGIMGCIVNGPGEMADADYGYVGAGPGKISLYRGQERLEANIPEEQAVERLLNLICKN